MTTIAPHPYAHVLHAIAEGREIQFRWPDGKIEDESIADVLIAIASGKAASPGAFLVKPLTITINGFKVPEPLREMPLDGTTVYWPDFYYTTKRSGVVGSYANTSRPDLAAMLRCGLLHLTPEAARAHAQALISFTIAS